MELLGFNEWLNESANRYSVEVNYRTSFDEVKDGFAQMVLGFVSAALKNRGVHVKKVLDSKPYRIIVSNHKWQEGEWVYVLSYHTSDNCFVITKGYYNRDRETVTKHSSEKCAGHSASELFKTIMNKVEGIKDEDPHHREIKPLKGKTGPTKGSIRPAQKFNYSPKGNERLGS